MSRWLDNAAGAFGEAALSTYTKLQEEKREKELLELRRKEEARAQAKEDREQKEYDRNLRADRNIARALAGNNDTVSLNKFNEWGLTDTFSDEAAYGVSGPPLGQDVGLTGVGLPSDVSDPFMNRGIFGAPGAPLPSMTDNILSGQAAPMGLPADEARAPAEMSVVSDVPFDVTPIGPLEVRSGERGELDYISMARNREQAAIYAARAGRWDMHEKFSKEAAKLRNDSVMATINTVTSTWGRAQDFVDGLGLGGTMEVEKLTGDKEGLSLVNIVDAEGNVVEVVGEFVSPQDLGGWLMSQSGYRDPVAVSEAIASSKANSLAMTASNREANYQRAQIAYNEAQANLSKLTAAEKQKVMTAKEALDEALANNDLDSAVRYATELATIAPDAYITNVKVRAVDGSEEEVPVNVAMSLVENHKTFPLQEELEALGQLIAMYNKGELTEKQYKDELGDWQKRTNIDPTSDWLRGNRSVRTGISLYGKDDDDDGTGIPEIVVSGGDSGAVTTSELTRRQKAAADAELLGTQTQDAFNRWIRPGASAKGNIELVNSLDPEVALEARSALVELTKYWKNMTKAQQARALKMYSPDSSLQGALRRQLDSKAPAVENIADWDGGISDE